MVRQAFSVGTSVGNGKMSVTMIKNNDFLTCPHEPKAELGYNMTKSLTVSTVLPLDGGNGAIMLESCIMVETFSLLRSGAWMSREF